MKNVGEGPGAIQRGAQLALVGSDSIALWDEGLRRLTVFDTLARVLRTTTDPVGDVVCCFDDGSFLTNAKSPARGFDVPVRQPVRWWRVPPTPGRPAREHILTVAGDDPPLRVGPLFGGMRMTFLVPAPLRPRALIGIAGDAIVYVRGDRPEYHVFDREGRPVHTVGVPTSPRPVTDIAATRVRQAMVPPESSLPKTLSKQEVAVIRRAYEKVARSAVLPDHMPALDRLLTESDGTVWLRAFQAPWEINDEETWWRFSGEGRLTGELRLRLDRGSRLIRFDSDHALIRNRADSSGFVVLHAIPVVPVEADP